MKKRLIACILATAMLIGCLAACGGNNESSAVSNEPSSQSGADEPSSKTSAPEND